MDSLVSTGKILTKARKNQGKSIPDMESLTKIRGKYLQALEDDQFHLLPGDVYVRGFLSTYASTLNLDAHALLEKYKKEMLDRAEEELAKTGRGLVSSSVPARIIKARAFLYLTILALIIIFIFLVEREGLGLS